MLHHRKIPVEVENSVGRSGRDVYCVTGTLEHLQAVIMKIKMKDWELYENNSLTSWTVLPYQRRPLSWGRTWVNQERGETWRSGFQLCHEFMGLLLWLYDKGSWKYFMRKENIRYDVFISSSNDVTSSLDPEHCGSHCRREGSISGGSSTQSLLPLWSFGQGWSQTIEEEQFSLNLM